MWAPVLAAGCGGFLGAALRYAVALGIPRRLGEFPWATLWVNLAGSLLIGAVLGWAEHSRLTPVVRALVVSGVLGALTTFSTFAFESFELWREGSGMLALGNVASNVAGCLLAVVMGWAIGEGLFHD